MNNEETKFYVYEILDNNDIPFYIGRTKNIKKRMYEHWRLATKRNGKYYICNKIRKLIQEYNYQLKWNIVYDGVTFQESIDKEINLIAKYKSDGLKLTNLTDGGEGTTGYVPIFTEEWKENLSKSQHKLYDSGYVQLTKGKSFEEIHGELKAKELKEKTGKKISEGIKNGTINHNKGKTIKELVGIERATELKKINSDTAKKTFTGKKQSQEHKEKRLKKQSETKQNWSVEQKIEASKRAKLAAEASIKRYNIKIILPNFQEEVLYASFTEISKLLLEKYKIKCGNHSISHILNGKANFINTKHKCQFIYVID